MPNVLYYIKGIFNPIKTCVFFNVIILVFELLQRFEDEQFSVDAQNVKKKSSSDRKLYSYHEVTQFMLNIFNTTSIYKQ